MGVGRMAASGTEFIPECAGTILLNEGRRRVMRPRIRFMMAMAKPFRVHLP
jgi:hypothetical protein